MAVRHQTERPKPVGTIIGVAIALGGITIFLVLMATGVVKLNSKGQAAQAPSRKVAPGGSPTQPTAPQPPGTKPQASTGTGPGLAVIRFSGQFTDKENTRKVETLCPGCGKPLDAGLPKCPGCNAAVKWPEKVKCGFCFKDKMGACGFCDGTGNCPVCSKGPRMLMGVRPPCAACNTTGKCPACDGSTLCGWCEEGWYYPGRPPPVKKKPEPPPPPPPQPETPAQPAPAPNPDPAPAPKTE